jgi:hypothetical protein
MMSLDTTFISMGLNISIKKTLSKIERVNFFSNYTVIKTE